VSLLIDSLILGIRARADGEKAVYDRRTCAFLDARPPHAAGRRRRLAKHEIF
jgi:hypothetical protein